MYKITLGNNPLVIYVRCQSRYESTWNQTTAGGNIELFGYVTIDINGSRFTHRLDWQKAADKCFKTYLCCTSWPQN